MAEDFGKPFLTAAWRHLAMLNFEIDPKVLLPLVPRGTEVDSWQGKCFVSMVGFLFLDTRVRGIPIPFHQNFEEINLRYYVRRKAEEGWRRGVVFVKEIVSRAAIALIARWLYNENYVALPTGNVICRASGGSANIESVKYHWTFQKRTQFLELATRGVANEFAEGSQEQFIAEHYWGYSSQSDGGTIEYRVDHPPWLIWQANSSRLDCDVENLYGKQFGRFLQGPPASAFLAAGSEITVFQGRKLV
jgi:uncharacterized protein YqjF (DUF2071 family)